MSIIRVSLRPAWRNYWFGILVAVCLLIVSLGLSISEADQGLGMGARIWFFAAMAVLGFVAFKRFLWKFTVDENRVSRHYGIISRNQQSVRIKDLRSIELDQSFFQRIFGIGNLAFYSAGTAEAEVKFIGIKKPSELRDKIDRALDELRAD